MLVSFAVMLIVAASSVSAQVLPILNVFSNRTFQGTVDVSWPVMFDKCTFLTDSIVLNHSYGAVFRNCSFESSSGVLYIADSGDGMVLADCEIKGCDKLMFSREFTPADRNYVTGNTLNGEECSVLDDQECIIDIDGLELTESVRNNKGPLILFMSTDKSILKSGEAADVRVRGLEEGMFVGWLSSDPDVRIEIDDDPFCCRVHAPAVVRNERSVIISAYTEYGLEAACIIKLMPETESKRRR